MSSQDTQKTDVEDRNPFSGSLDVKMDVSPQFSMDQNKPYILN